MPALTKEQLERENGFLRAFIAKYAMHLLECSVMRNLGLCNCGFNEDLRKLRDHARGNVPVGLPTTLTPSKATVVSGE